MESKGNLTIFAALGLFALFAVLFFIQGSSVLQASEHENLLNGYAWSSNVGWISFSCANEDPQTCGSQPDYQVKIDPPTGKFSGYAWSSNIGWIDFEPPAPYPETPTMPATVRAVSSDVCASGLEAQGWVRADAGSDASGWDGWIKLAGETSGGAHYGVCLMEDGNSFEGFAWGSDVVGWVQFEDETNWIFQPPTAPIHIRETRPR